MILWNKVWTIRAGIAVVAVALVWGLWLLTRAEKLPDGIVNGNGRIEAVEIDIAAKQPGRIRDILVDEGALVTQGQVVAYIETDALNAQRAEADARLQQALNAIDTAQSQVTQRLSERAAAIAVIRQREAELNAARKRLDRSATLAREGATSMQERDDDQARVEGARASVEAAKAQLAAVDAAIRTARSQVTGARSNVDATRATIARLDVDIADNTLKAPRSGRIQYRIAEVGEIVGAGGRILNLVNLSDVYMTFFLPETAAGRVGLGSEVRLVLDAAPEYVIPATVSFVADVAQFTPKTVETENERQKLMFRVKARVNPDLLRRQVQQVKTGLPGTAYVRIQRDTAWPEWLALSSPR